jgi:hypothetical protein
VTNPRKVRLTNRVVTVVGGALIVAVLAWLFATGSPLAGRFVLGGVGVAGGYGLVHLAAGTLVPPRTSRGRLAWTAGMALVVCSSVFANAAVGEGLYTPTSSVPAELLADGLLFGISFGAMVRLFAPPTEGEGS